MQQEQQLKHFWNDYANFISALQSNMISMLMCNLHILRQQQALCAKQTLWCDRSKQCKQPASQFTSLHVGLVGQVHVPIPISSHSIKRHSCFQLRNFTLTQADSSSASILLKSRNALSAGDRDDIR